MKHDENEYHMGALIADIARLAGLNDDLTSGIRRTRSIALLYRIRMTRVRPT
jgi:hypothetical protein